MAKPARRPPVTVRNPDVPSFDRAYLRATGFAVLPGRAAKLFRVMSQAHHGTTVFGTCEVRWADGAKTLTIVP